MLTTNCVISLRESAPCGINPSPPNIQPDVFSFCLFNVSLPWVSPLYLAQRRDSEKQGFCGDRMRLGSLTLMERLKRSDRDTGGEATVRTWGIFSQASHPVFPTGPPWDRCQTYICCSHVLWQRIVVSFIYIYTSMYFCLLFFSFFFLTLAVLCVCVYELLRRGHNSNSWSPWESETAERPDSEGWGMRKQWEKEWNERGNYAHKKKTWEKHWK